MMAKTNKPAPDLQLSRLSPELLDPSIVVKVSTMDGPKCAQWSWWMDPHRLVVWVSLLVLLWLLLSSWGFGHMVIQGKKPAPAIPVLNVAPGERLPQSSAGQSPSPVYYGRMVWMRDVRQLLLDEGASAPLATEIARWLMFYCRYYKVPPDIALAVMFVESRFERFAVSPVGARGLMQVMAFWRGEFGEKDDNLFDVEVNIRYGCGILRRYMNRYPTIDDALSAYNGSVGSRRYARKVRAAMRRFGAIPTLADLNG
ncbi:MAG: transglycosylase SLT domain-containing protein [Mariprofundales bacterium]